MLFRRVVMDHAELPELKVRIPIHVVLLSEAESAQCGFVESVGAIPLKTWANEHPDDLLCRFTEEITNIRESQRDSIIQPRVGPQRGTTLGHPPKQSRRRSAAL